MPVALLPVAHGSIGAPQSAVPAISEVAQNLTDQPDCFLLPWQGSPLPTSCIDGRPTRNEASVSASACALRLAGGTLSVWVGAVLSGVVPMPTDSQAAVESLRDLCQQLHEQGFALATHTDDHAQQPNCGCGAADHLGAVLGLFDTQYDAIAQMISDWGIDASERRNQKEFPSQDGIASTATHCFTHGPIPQAPVSHTLRAGRKLAGYYAVLFTSALDRARRFSPTTIGVGQELNSAIRSIDDNANSQVLGAHREVLAVINTRPGTCLDRSALVTKLATASLELEKDPQAFVVDLWTLPAVASALGLEGSRKNGFITAAAAFNAAALIALSGPTMLFCTL